MARHQFLVAPGHRATASVEPWCMYTCVCIHACIYVCACVSVFVCTWESMLKRTCVSIDVFISLLCFQALIVHTCVSITFLHQPLSFNIFHLTISLDFFLTISPCSVFQGEGELCMHFLLKATAEKNILKMEIKSSPNIILFGSRNEILPY